MANPALIDRGTTVFAGHKTSEFPDPSPFFSSESLHLLWHLNRSNPLILRVSYVQTTQQVARQTLFFV